MLVHRRFWSKRSCDDGRRYGSLVGLNHTIALTKEGFFMYDAASQVAHPLPLYVRGRPLAWQAAAVVAGTLALAASSYLAIPMAPVPITMQTFAVTVVGALYGWRLGTITVVAWLAEAALGLPVLANGAAGLQHFAGPTAGYLFGFPFVAALVGALAERGWTGRRVGLSFVAMLLGNLLCLVLGGAWLSAQIGAEAAVRLGVEPFLLGGLLKSALGTALLAALSPFWSRSARP